MNNNFRFFDSRQKYLLFVTTTNEKNIIAEKISTQIKKIKPKKPSLNILDAGLGDGTLLMSVLRNCHREFPTIPFLVYGKEISMEDVRLSIEKLPDRFMEHPNMIFLASNLYYSEIASLNSSNPVKQQHIKWDILKLKGNSSFEFNQQLSQLDTMLQNNWQVERHPTSGNPTYKSPSVLIIYRKDHEFSLDHIIPKQDGAKNYFDLIIASQPYRSRISVQKKVDYVVKPMIQALASKGRLILVHASGNDPSMKIIKKVWPDENPFPSLSSDITAYLKRILNKNILRKLKLHSPEIFRYNLRALPNEIENGIATSLIFSSWNAATYVGQINNEKVMEAEQDGQYVHHIQKTIKKHGGLWFNDELLVIEQH